MQHLMECGQDIIVIIRLLAYVVCVCVCVCLCVCERSVTDCRVVVRLVVKWNVVW